jgi:capsular exopolysaccharide synthesis family protein
MDLAAHFRVIAQNWMRILIISALLGAAVFLASSLRADVYQGKSVLVVKPGSINPGQAEQDAATFQARTYAEYVDTRPVILSVLRNSELPISPSEAADRISANPVGDLGFLEIKGTGPTREEAEAITRYTTNAVVEFVQNIGDAKREAVLRPIRTERNEITQEMADLPADSVERVNLQLRLNNLNAREADAFSIPVDQVNILGGAIASENPVSPKPLRDGILGFLIALVLVSELTVLAHYSGDRLSGSEDSSEIADLTGLPVLAKIPRGEGIEVVEAFRVLRTNLMVLEGAGKPRTVAIVSANQAAGKTFTATHLAESAAGLEEKIVLIDADLRKPAVHERLGIPRAPGISSVLQGGDLTTALTRVPDNPYLRVLPSGAPVQDASGILGARSFRHVLDALRAVRLVIVDTPPINLFADGLAVASQCDATIVVLDVKTSRRRQVRQAVESLERAGANLIGVVINRASVQKTASYYEG